jgi:hypothetical protein
MINEASIDVATTVADERSTPFDTVVGETVKEPQFHRFQDMPLELRLRVYEEYFIDEHDFICRGWLRIGPGEAGVIEYAHPYAHSAHISTVTSSKQFFPNLCLVNRETGFEAAKFLISTADLFVNYYKFIERVISKLGLFRDHQLLENIHRLDFNCLGCIYNYEHNWSRWSRHRNSTYPTTTFHACMRFVSQCPQLRQLTLRFIVSLQSCSLICPRYDTEEAHQVLSFEPIFACKELQKLNVIGVKLDYISDPKAIIDQEQETIWNMEQWLMDEFAARGKVVDVQTDYVSRSSDKEESDEEESDEEASDDEEGSNEEYVYTCPRSNQLLTDPW